MVQFNHCSYIKIILYTLNKIHLKSNKTYVRKTYINSKTPVKVLFKILPVIQTSVFSNQLNGHCRFLIHVRP